MTNSTTGISLRNAALIAGLAILTMAIAAPFAEFFVYPKLVVSGNAAETAKNIIAHKTLFASGIFGYVITFICDVLAAWALYVLLKPVNDHLSLLTASFRLLYPFIPFFPIFNLLTLFPPLPFPVSLA